MPNLWEPPHPPPQPPPTPPCPYRHTTPASTPFFGDECSFYFFLFFYTHSCHRAAQGGTLSARQWPAAFWESPWTSTLVALTSSSPTMTTNWRRPRWVSVCGVASWWWVPCCLQSRCGSWLAFNVRDTTLFDYTSLWENALWLCPLCCRLAGGGGGGVASFCACECACVCANLSMLPLFMIT